MSFATDIAGDFEAVCDGLISLTITPPASYGGSAFSAPTQRRQITVREAAESAGKYTTRDAVLNFAVSHGTPIISGTIADADGTWTILETDEQTLNARWRCVCRRLLIPTFDSLSGPHDPNSTLGTLEKRVSSQALDGSAVFSWVLFAQPVRAKAHEESAQRVLNDGRRSSVITGTIYFQTDYALDEGYRFISNDSLIYTFVSDQERDSITGLYGINFERYV
jgi:hypothetical protein